MTGIVAGLFASAVLCVAMAVRAATSRFGFEALKDEVKARDSFAEADGEGVIEERGREAVADACFLPSDERADEDGVAEHGR